MVSEYIAYEMPPTPSEPQGKLIPDNSIYEPFEVDLKNGDDFEILGKVVRVWIERTF
jgi:SOS-response transcriptional repressor LexA